MRDLKEYRIATSPAEAVALLRAGPGKGRFIAGGTDMFLGRAACDFVVDINQAGLAGIERTDQGDVLIGAATPLQLCHRSEELGAFAGGELARMAGQCGNRPVRSTATIGGNLCNALPSADLAPVLLVLDAVCFVMDEESQESLPLADFFVGPRLTVLEGRLLTGLILPAEAASRHCHAIKLTRTAEDISLVQAAVGLDVAEGIVTTARIALGSVAPKPLRCHLAEDQLAGLKVADITQDLLADVALIAAGESDPIDDHRASAEYRQEMARVLTRRLLCRALADTGTEACNEGDEGGAA